MGNVVHEKGNEWGGYTIREAPTGHILERRSRIEGNVDGLRVLVPYGGDFPKGTDFSADWNEWIDNGAAFAHLTHRRPGAKVLRRGQIVR